MVTRAAYDAAAEAWRASGLGEVSERDCAVDGSPLMPFRALTLSARLAPANAAAWVRQWLAMAIVHDGDLTARLFEGEVSLRIFTSCPLSEFGPLSAGDRADIAGVP